MMQHFLLPTAIMWEFTSHAEDRANVMAFIKRDYDNKNIDIKTTMLTLTDSSQTENRIYKNRLKCGHIHIYVGLHIYVNSFRPHRVQTPIPRR